MIDSYGIYKLADKIMNSYGTRDPYDIAESSGIIVDFPDFMRKLMGMYTYKMKVRSMFVSPYLSEPLTRIVGAHELGHDLLHRQLAKDGLKEFQIFHMKNTTEYEANAFAAHLLLDTDECVELARNGYDVVAISAMQNVVINLTLIKFQELMRLGYDFRLPMTANGDFLKNVDRGEC